MIFRISIATTLLLLLCTASTTNAIRQMPCYDYSVVFGDVGYDKCSGKKLYKKMKKAFKEQNTGTDVTCVGGFNRDINAITNTVGQGEENAIQTLQDMCDDALDVADALCRSLRCRNQIVTTELLRSYEIALIEFEKHEDSDGAAEDICDLQAAGNATGEQFKEDIIITFETDYTSEQTTKKALGLANNTIQKVVQQETDLENARTLLITQSHEIINLKRKI